MFRKRQSAGLTDEEAEWRVQKMIAFILNDAHEKAAEIEAQAEQDALRIYQQRLSEAEQQLRREYDEKRRQAEAAYRRRQGQRLVAAELDVLRMRWEKVSCIRLSLHQRLASLCQPQPLDGPYVTFMAYLLAEALLRVADEDKVQVCYRKVDTPLMVAVRARGSDTAAAVLRSQAGLEKRWCVELLEDQWLSLGHVVATESSEEKDRSHINQQALQPGTDANRSVTVMPPPGQHSFRYPAVC